MACAVLFNLCFEGRKGTPEGKEAIGSFLFPSPLPSLPTLSCCDLLVFTHWASMSISVLGLREGSLTLKNK